ncbi:MAG: TatD family hydrolase [Sulfuricaulis sp.]|uniref:TatD family hydrolase n=1 Tax=Sulfuricaulis sp. TaxID=2003553 RepID=UPI0025CC5299|nr:TatD family hydrolase [Sulfuricaulis sp.]MCR4345927.1 TatD family hydrolase [Sulfuricaulis sp.]
MTPLVDSHCHLNFEPLNVGLTDVLQRARDNGVGHMLCVSVTLETFPEIRTLAHDHANVFASVGVHPNEREGREPSVEDLTTLANDARVVAIGETGLDYYRRQGDMAWQQERFRCHIRAAKESGKPLIIHTRDAAADTLRIMREEAAGDIGGVMHCFTESWETARAALDLNFHISFSGIVTFRNADALREVAKQVPQGRLLVETDAPYLAPMPHRGKTNEPAFVRHVAECLADLRGTTIESVAEDTTRNFFSLFKGATTQAVHV